MGDSHRHQQPVSSLNSLVSGAVAGAVEATVTYPTEFVKTQLQLKSSAFPKPTFTNVITNTIKNYGVLGLYRGVGALVTGTAAKAGIRFLTYENAKRFLTPESEKSNSSYKLPLYRLVLAGTISGAVEALTVVTPTETIKTKLIHDSLSTKPRFNGMIDVIYKEGLSGIYRGAASVTARQAANSGVRLTTYTVLRNNGSLIYGVKNMDEGSWYFSFINGAIAGIVTVYSTMPIDVVKTRMQSLDAKTLYKSSLHCFSTIVKNDGVLALWKGTTPRLARLIFSGGIVFSVYENVSSMLKQYI